MNKVNCASIVSGRMGERLFDHIVYEGTGFNVGKEDFFSVNVLGKLVTENVTTYKGNRLGLKSFDLDDRDCRSGVITKNIYDSPVRALVFIQGPKRKHLSPENFNRLYTNVRVPMSSEYWKEISRIERSENREHIKEDKSNLKNKFDFDFDLRNSGCYIVLPEEGRNFSSYLVAMSANGSFEWVLSRQSKYPNAYKIECDSIGNVKFHDTRKVARQVAA